VDRSQETGGAAVGGCVISVRRIVEQRDGSDEASNGSMNSPFFRLMTALPRVDPIRHTLRPFGTEAANVVFRRSAAVCAPPPFGGPKAFRRGGLSTMPATWSQPHDADATV
jgi:hypothetical protein